MGFSKIIKDESNPVGFVLYKPNDYNHLQKYPLLIFLHGLGGRGDGGDADLDKLLQGEIPIVLQEAMFRQWEVSGESYQFLFMAPQLNSNDREWPLDGYHVTQMLNYATQNLAVDPDRIYLTGISAGGAGVWCYLSYELSKAQKIAAAVVVSAPCRWNNLCNISKGNTGIWAFHALNDNAVNVNCTNTVINSVNNCIPHGVVPAKKTLLSTGGHWIWNTVYSYTISPGIEGEVLTVYEYLLRCTNQNPLQIPTGNIPLVADAGTDESVVENNAGYILDGSSSSGWQNAWWEILEIPDNAIWDIFSSVASQIRVKLKNLIPGQYRFRLTIQNGIGEILSDEKTLTVASYSLPSETSVSPWWDGYEILITSDRIISNVKVIYDDGTAITIYEP